MGKYTELYEQIQIDKQDQTYLKNMIRFYMAEKPLSYHEFYASLLNSNHHIQDRRNQQEKQKLYEDIFQKWRRSICSLNKKAIKSPIDLVYKKEELVTLYQALKKITTYEEMEQDPVVSQFFFQEILGIQTSKWCHLESRKINCQKGLIAPINHRLYLNCQNSDIDFIIRRLLEKFEEKTLTYNLKFDTSEIARDDKIIIYTDTFHLLDYIIVLKEFEREYPEIMKRTSNPPILVGKIDQWIGYGDEPEYEAESYNDLRTRLFYDTITNQTLNRILNDKEALRDMAYYFIEVKKIVPITSSDKLTTYRILIPKLIAEIKQYLSSSTYQSEAFNEILKTLPHFIQNYLDHNIYYFDDLMEQLQLKLKQYHISSQKLCFNSDTWDKFQLFEQKDATSNIELIESLNLTITPNYFVTDEGRYQSIQNILYLNMIRFMQPDGTFLGSDGIREQGRLFLEYIAETYFTKKKILYSEIYRKEIRGNTGKVYLLKTGYMTPWEYTEFLGDILLSKQITFKKETKSVRDCMNELERYLPESGIIYTKYNRRMNLLDFLIESFQQQNFEQYQDAIEWFYEQTANNPGVFSMNKEDKKEEKELLSKIKIETLVF